MSLILATGSNIGDSLAELKKAKQILSEEFEFVAQSRVYKSGPVDYLEQDDFYNQVLEFKLPKLSPLDVLSKLQNIEKKMGRHKVIDKGPRNIDIDIIFWGTESFNSKELVIPHSAWSQRSFVVLPLQELPAYQMLRNNFKFPVSFDSIATPIMDN